MTTNTMKNYDFSDSVINPSAAKGIRARLLREVDTDFKAREADLLAQPPTVPHKSRKAWAAKVHEVATRTLGDTIVLATRVDKHTQVIFHLPMTPENGRLYAHAYTMNAKRFELDDVQLEISISLHAVERAVERADNNIVPRTIAIDILRYALTAALGGAVGDEVGPVEITTAYGVLLGEVVSPRGVYIKTVLPAGKLSGERRRRWLALKPGCGDVTRPVGTGAGECSS